MGVAYVFSKIQPKATILAIISLLVVALATHVLPVLGLILCLFATIPGIVLWLSLIHISEPTRRS